MVTMRFRKAISAFAASVVLIGGASVAHADADVCKRVKFQFKNERAAQIRVNKVQYYNVANNKTVTENVDKVCLPSFTCTTSGDNLPDAEGIRLKSFVFFFNDREKDGDWSKTDYQTQVKVPVTEICAADMTYKGNPAWTINN
jgi:hypothetical protein